MVESLSISDVANQPRSLWFLECSFVNKGEKRSFKAAWFDTWPWLDYQDSIICFYCSCANNRKLLTKGLYGTWEETFLSNGFINWKDACASFRRHKTSKIHIDARARNAWTWYFRLLRPYTTMAVSTANYSWLCFALDFFRSVLRPIFVPPRWSIASVVGPCERQKRA